MGQEDGPAAPPTPNIQLDCSMEHEAGNPGNPEFVRHIKWREYSMHA